MFQKIVTILILLVMMALINSPLKFAMFYFLFRPLVQPFATEGYKFVGSIPLTSLFVIMVIGYSTIVCIIRRDYTLFGPNSLFFYGILFFSSFSFLNTLNVAFSIGHILKIMIAIAMSNMVYSALKTRKDGKEFLWLLVIASIIPMLIGYYEFFTGKGHMTYLEKQ